MKSRRARLIVVVVAAVMGAAAAVQQALTVRDRQFAIIGVSRQCGRSSNALKTCVGLTPPERQPHAAQILEVS